MKDAELYDNARRRVRAVRGLIVHAGVYAVVITGLFLINLATRSDGGDWWFYWPAVGWGIGLGCHAVAIASGAAGRLDEWEDRKVREIVERERTHV